MSSSINKYFTIRIGSNAEKSYIYNTVPFIDFLLVKANFFESSSGFLSSLFIRTNLEKRSSAFYIDPCTYVFAMDPDNPASIRSWIKCRRDQAVEKISKNLYLTKSDNPYKSIREIENPTDKDHDKVEIYAIKRAYRKLADTFFSSPLNTEIGKRPITIDDFSSSETRREFIDKVVTYQRNVLINRYNKEKFKDFQTGITEPRFILCPYFVITDNNWFELMNSIWIDFDNHYLIENSGIVIVITREWLCSNIERLVSCLTSLKTNNFFIWIDGFKEDIATDIELNCFTRLVTELSGRDKQIFDLYSGGFTTMLLPFGLTGITNGPYYGLDRNIEPVQGGIPTAQYYIPTLHKRQQVLESYKLIQQNNIGDTKEDFHQKVCSCPICVDGIRHDTSDMLQYFGELGPVRLDKNGNKRRYPSQSAIERCNYHFILSRLIEYRSIKDLSKEEVLSRIEQEISLWKVTNAHLNLWLDILKKYA